MPNFNYNAGRRFEYKVKKQLERAGNIVMRTAGSHGPFDLIAISPEGEIGFVQCKRVETAPAAKRLIEKFRESPPLPKNGGYEQELVVYVSNDRSTRTAIV